MKKITVTGYEKATDIGHDNPRLSTMEVEGPEEMDASDGFHTFTELYDHRITLFVALCRQLWADPRWQTANQVWRSKLHNDGTSFDGWFIMGINENAGEQITYHLPMSWWDKTEFAPTKERAPEWDGHTPADVLARLKAL